MTYTTVELTTVVFNDVKRGHFPTNLPGVAGPHRINKRIINSNYMTHIGSHLRWDHIWGYNKHL